MSKPAGHPKPNATSSRPTEIPGLGSTEVAAILLITALAAVLRFDRLPEVPPGLHFDEGFKGVTARELLEGAPLQLFFETFALPAERVADLHAVLAVKVLLRGFAGVVAPLEALCDCATAGLGLGFGLARALVGWELVCGC